MSRPLRSSMEIAEQLTEMNARFEAKTQMILDQMPKSIENNFAEELNRLQTQQANQAIRNDNEHNTIIEQLKSVSATITGMAWAMTIMLVIVVFMWMSTWQGCDVTPIPKPNPAPIPVPGPGPNPTPSPQPSPNPSPNVFQLDSLEMTVFNFAVENHRGDTDAARRASFYFLLGNIRVKDEMIRLWPTIPQVELLP